MERSEPALIPEWLKSNGSITGGNHSNHSHSVNQQSPSSSLHADGRGNVHNTRNKYTYSNGGYDSPRSVISDPSYFSRKSATNGSVMHEKNSHLRPCNSFGRNRRDREWDTDLFDFSSKERWFQGDRRGGYSNPFGVSTNSLKNGFEKLKLRRSQSVVSEKQDEFWSRPKATDARIHNKNDSNGAGSIVSDSTQKAVPDEDVPSVEAEDKPTTPDIVRVSSPVLTSSTQGFPAGASPVIGRDGWNSALADMPAGAGSNSMLNASVQQNAPAAVSTVASTMGNGLSMAETLAQVPTRTHSAPQISVDTQRLEELAIKQSRQLIPVTSLPPKTSVLKPERLKPKPSSRSETAQVLKSGHQQLCSPHLVNNTSRAGPAKSDGAPGHGGKLFILRSAHERNGISPGDKDSHTKSDTVANNPSVVVAPAVAHVRGSNNLNHTATEHKASSHPAIYAPTVEKRPTAFQAQSRNDFFKLMREKSATNLSSAPAVTKCVSSTVLKTAGTTDVSLRANDPILSDISCHDWSASNGASTENNCGACEESSTFNNKEMHSIPFEVVHLDEEERKFLCSLGWDENAGEDEGLTEEEINEFNISYKEYKQMKPNLKLNCSFWQPKRLSPFISHLDSLNSAESSSSDSDSDA